MSVRNIVMCVLSVVLMVYLAIAIPMSASYTDAQTLTDFQVVVHDDTDQNFVNEEEIANETDSLNFYYKNTKRGDVDIWALYSHINELDKVEKATVSILNDGTLYIDVIPMDPIARVFHPRGSHYINSDGKKIGTSLKYRIDVPIVLGSFTGKFQPKDLGPLLKYIKKDKTFNSLVSAVKVEKNGDIILIPTIKGHVINFGDTTMIANKWSRLKTMYRDVLPAKGWETYDTLSVKWSGQVVATLKKKKAPPVPFEAVLMADNTEVESTDVMEAEDTNPGGFMLPQ